MRFDHPSLTFGALYPRGTARNAEAFRYNIPMPFVEGYLNTLSAAPGEAVQLFASSNAERCSLEIYREGAEEKRVYALESLRIGEHPVPEKAWETGAGWPECWELKIPEIWTSGVYRVELHACGARHAPKHSRWCDQAARHDILLVVRSARPAAQHKILLQLTTNTYMAYNAWGGRSTYGYECIDGQSADRVSLLRPGHGYYGDTIARAEFPQWERPFVHWCDKNGYGLDYAVNYDLERWPSGFEDYRLILSVGHDEYWSSPMRDNLERFIERGGHVAFFSGNAVCWQVRFEDGGRSMVAYKHNYQDDPKYKSGENGLVTTLWSHPLIGRPENRLTGVGFLMGGYHRFLDQFLDGKGAYTVRRADHWVLEGTGLKAGDTFGGTDEPAVDIWRNIQLAFRSRLKGPRSSYHKNPILGYECDGCDFEEVAGYPVPKGTDGTPRDFVILAQAPCRWAPGDANSAPARGAGVRPEGRATMGVYTRGGTVFTAGTTDWVYGLAHSDAVQRITKNVLNRLGKL